MESAAEILGIAEGATAKQARKAYRKKALECHPDRHPGCEAQFQKLTRAYEMFIQPEVISITPIPLSPFHFDTRNVFN